MRSVEARRLPVGATNPLVQAGAGLGGGIEAAGILSIVLLRLELVEEAGAAGGQAQ